MIYVFIIIVLKLAVYFSKLNFEYSIDFNKNNLFNYLFDGRVNIYVIQMKIFVNWEFILFS